MPTSDPPRTMIATPSRISSPPRVTMNDGIFSRATSVPWMAPNAELASSATMIGAHHEGQDHGQNTGVAAADPEPRGPEVLAERLSEELGRDVGRGGVGVEGK